MLSPHLRYWGEPTIVVSCEMLLLLGCVVFSAVCGVQVQCSVCIVFSVWCALCTVQCGVWCVECVHYIIFIFLELVRPGLPPAQPARSLPTSPGLASSGCGLATRAQLDHAVFLIVIIFQMLFQI